MTGTIYLLHFNQSYVPYPGAPARSCACHYIGWTLNLPDLHPKAPARTLGTASGLDQRRHLRQDDPAWGLPSPDASPIPESLPRTITGKENPHVSNNG
jgi:hypothetical protein